MEITKKCKICGITKSTNEFYKKHAKCKPCFNIFRKGVKPNRHETVKATLDLLTIELDKISNTNDVDRAIQLSEEIIKALVRIKEEHVPIEIEWKLSPTIKSYYKKCFDKQLSHAEIKTKVYDKSLKDVFSSIFGVDRNEILESINELNNLFTLIIALSTAYNYFIEIFNNTNQEVFQDKFTKVEEVKFEYNFANEHIEISHNPLMLTLDEFMQKIKTETLTHYGFKYYHVNDTFLPIYQSLGF